jgi:hypothetical protein
MDKKDIYEHLAKIYLDASTKKTGKERTQSKLYRNIFVISVIFVFALSLGMFFNYRRHKTMSSETSLVLLSEAAKLNFHFGPAKKETYSFTLNKLNLSTYKMLAFNVKKINYGNIALRVEFVNPFKEKSEYYLKDVPNKWGEFKVKLADFKGINDWTEMSGLQFSVEEWNAKDNKGVVYIDNVRLLK